MNKIIESFILDSVEIPLNQTVEISVVAYEHPAGIPARFLTGFIPAITLAKHFESRGVKSVIRVIDPTSIANYCNGWRGSQARFQEIISNFFCDRKIDFFFDEAEPVNWESLEILQAIGSEIATSTDPQIVDLVSRIRESGKKHGGENGEKNSLIYLAAHPFSWHDLHHPAIWKTAPTLTHTYINLISKAEERFTVVRKFVRNLRKDLRTCIDPLDRYMTVCNTPCYIRLQDEPTYDDLVSRGPEWCEERYRDLKARNRNCERISRDFQIFISHLGLNRVG